MRDETCVGTIPAMASTPATHSTDAAPTAPAARDSAPTPTVTATPTAWSVEAAKDLYNIDGWGDGYFDVSAVGHVSVDGRERLAKALVFVGR